MRMNQGRALGLFAVLLLVGCAPDVAEDRAGDTQAGPGDQAAGSEGGPAAASTQALMALYKRWLLAAPEQKASLHAELVAMAKQRRELLAQSIANAPADVLRVAIPDHKRAEMPADLVSLLERRVEVEGVLDVVYEDYEDGSHRLRQRVRTDAGETFELHVSGTSPQWRSGALVRAEGWMLDSAQGSVGGDLAVDARGESLLLLGDGTTTTTTTTTTLEDLPNTLGAQRTLVVLVNFQNDPTNKPWTTTEANSLVFGTVSDFYKENSSQQTWLTGSVAGWYTIPMDNTVCDGFAIQNYAKQAAAAAGYDLTTYQRFVYAFPKNACGYSGMGQVGAYPSATWINGSLILRTVAHEMGHNLGLSHAHALDCGATTLGTTCSSQEYGDTVDVMGYSGTVGHFNTFNKERLGWLSSSNVISVTSGGSFSIAPNSIATTGPKALKISRGTDASGNPSFYYVEYRQPVGFDSKITERGVIDTANIFGGVTLRQASPAVGNSGYLLDMTPGSNFVDMKDAALTVGKQFSDPAAGVTVSTESATSGAASVKVAFGGQTCTRATPTIALSPAQSPWIAAGTAYTYQVSVKNNDSSSCSSTQFSITPTKPTGWTATVGSGALTIAPGASATTTLTITSSTTAADGFYMVAATAAGNGLSASTSATYVVDNPLSNSAPIAVDDFATLTQSSVTIAVLANDRDPDGSALRLVSVTRPSKGTATVNSNGTVTYVPGKRFRTSDSFSYTITDGTYSATGQVTVSK